MTITVYHDMATLGLCCDFSKNYTTSKVIGPTPCKYFAKKKNKKI